MPDAVVERMRKAQDKRAEGKKICIEIIQQVMEIEGVAGIHMMAYKQEEAAVEIIEKIQTLKVSKNL